MDGPFLTLLGKPDCGLCLEMKAAVQRVLSGGRARLVERDISQDPALNHRYRLLIPVLLFQGQEIARYRVTEAELERRLRALGLLGGP